MSPIIENINKMEEIHYLLGNNCNLDCDFCFWDTRMPDVSLEFKKIIIDEIVKTGIRKVTISGGEPLCSNNFLETIKYMYEKKLEIILHTNGLKLNKKLAEQIAPMISRISLTLDASNNDMMKKMRKNEELLNHTLFLIELFNNLNVKVNIKTLVTKVNKEDIINIGKILQSLPIQYWSLLEFNPIGRGKKNKNKFYISCEEFDKVVLKIKNKFSDIPIRARRYSLANSQYCFISPNGEVYTYHPDKGNVLMGNLKENSLSSTIFKIENANL